ncbi:hypothetical protein EDC96DRAFT_550227 [Choanephora cucurbitarum]|nr:hypothetical protein EDC96DRAFT_550227 [Choanephora cucurbitarum]
MNSANNTYNNNNNNNSSGPVPALGRDTPVLEEFGLDDCVLSPEEGSSLGQHNVEAMEVDTTVDHVGIRHEEIPSSDEAKDIQSEIAILKQRIEGNKAACKLFKDQLDAAMRLPIPDDLNELALNEHRISALSKRVETFNAAITSDMELLASNKKAQFEDQSRINQLRVLNKKSSDEGSCLDIRESDLPKFKIKPLFERNSASPSQKPLDEDPVSDFIQKFERLYLVKRVDVSQHWYFHLHTCFSDDSAVLNWYRHHVKNPIEIQKKKITWEAVKDLMKERFGNASNTDVFLRSERLLNARQRRDEIFLEYLDRFNNYLSAAKIRVDDCSIFIIHFLNTLFGKSLKDKAIEILKDENYKRSLRKGTGSTADSKYADDEHYIPSSFLDFESIMYKHKVELNDLSSEILLKTKEKEAQNLSNIENKKRKLAADVPAPANVSNSKETKANVNDINTLVSLLDLKTSLSQEQLKKLRDSGLCTFCRVNKYSKEHIDNCVPRKEYMAKKKVNTIKDDVIKTENNTEKKVFFSRTTDDDLAPLSDASDDDDSSIDEYAVALAQYDQSLLDGTYNDSENKAVFSISKYSSSNDRRILISSLNSPPKKRSNTVGDIDNPFETKNLAYAPVSCITINNVLKFP